MTLRHSLTFGVVQTTNPKLHQRPFNITTLNILYLCLTKKVSKLQSRGGSKVFDRGGHMYKSVCGGVRFADFISFFLKYPMK